MSVSFSLSLFLSFYFPLKGDIGCTLNFNLPFDRLIGPASAYLQASGLSGCAYLLQLIFLTRTLTHSRTFIHATSHFASFLLPPLLLLLLLPPLSLTLLFHSLSLTLFTILFLSTSLSLSVSLFSVCAADTSTPTPTAWLLLQCYL